MKTRWKELVIAFFMAIALWYVISGSEKVESQVEVRVDYRGLPNGLVVRAGLVNKVNVRVRAPIGMLRALATRNTVYLMDLSSVKKGENTLVIDSSQLPFLKNIEVMDVAPSRILLDVDEIASKQVPVIAEISGSFPKDYVAQAGFTPPEVTLSGASGALAFIDKLRVPVVLDAFTKVGMTESIQRLPVPEGLEASPPEAKLTLHVGLKRKLVTVTRSVSVETPSHFGKFIRPEKVKIQVAVPESMVPRAASDTSIRAFADLEHFEVGSHNLPVLVSLPEGAELVQVEPAIITVTLEQPGQEPRPTGNGNNRPRSGRQ